MIRHRGVFAQFFLLKVAHFTPQVGWVCMLIHRRKRKQERTRRWAWSWSMILTVVCYGSVASTNHTSTGLADKNQRVKSEKRTRQTGTQVPYGSTHDQYDKKIEKEKTENDADFPIWRSHRRTPVQAQKSRLFLLPYLPPFLFFLMLPRRLAPAPTPFFLPALPFPLAAWFSISLFGELRVRGAAQDPLGEPFVSASLFF